MRSLLKYFIWATALAAVYATLRPKLLKRKDLRLLLEWWDQARIYWHGLIHTEPDEDYHGLIGSYAGRTKDQEGT